MSYLDEESPTADELFEDLQLLKSTASEFLTLNPKEHAGACMCRRCIVRAYLESLLHE